MTEPCPDVHFLVLAKGAERYIFFYTDKYRAETVKMMGRMAINPQLSFTWYDAAVLSQRVRECRSAQ